MPLITGSSSPGDTEEGRSRAFKQAQRLTGSTGGSVRPFAESRSRGLGTRTNVRLNEGAKDARTLRRERGLRTGGTTNVSESAKKLLSNGDFAKDFARQAKEITTRRGLTRSQRKAHMGAVKTRLAVEGGQLTGDAAEQALDLSRTSTERGLTSSQRTGLSSASQDLLEGAVSANAPEEDGGAFEESLLKFFDI